MKTKTYSFYSYSKRAWVHFKAYNIHDALDKARTYDANVDYADIRLYSFS